MLLNFNPSEFVPETGSFEVIPEGTELRVIVESEEEKVSKTSGISYLTFKIKVIDGPYKNRVIFHDLFLNHSGVAQRIARESVNTMAQSCGLDPAKLKATNELHRKPMTMVVKVEHDAQYGDKNKVKYFKASGAVRVSPVAQMAQMAPVAPVAAAAPAMPPSAPFDSAEDLPF